MREPTVRLSGMIVVVEPKRTDDLSICTILSAIDRECRPVAVHEPADLVAALAELADASRQRQRTVVILSHHLNPDIQSELIAQVKESGPEGSAIVVCMPSIERDRIASFQSAGADGFLLAPISRRQLSRTLCSLASTGSGEAREQIVNLPLVLDQIAGRLESLASRLQNEGLAAPSEDHARQLIKEALLSAAGSEALDDEQFAEAFVDWAQAKLRSVQ
ncbi:MAG: hypothetical protein KDD44_06190 [Bdellovibrionales bacterium]|nr:hypothetical protein [Bdellovibrionales bacterium]